MRDAGMRIEDISKETGLASQKIYRLQNTRMDRILNKDQKECLRHIRELARMVSSGIITPASLAKRMEGKLKSCLVYRCVHGLVEKYKELRRKVKESNARKKDKKVKVKKKDIWNYILKGETECGQLLEMKVSHPEVQNTIDLCTGFIGTLFGKAGSMTLDEWIGLAEKDKDMHSFVEYVKSDKEAVELACTTNYSNGIMEGTVNKIKEIKRTMFNRAEIELLRAKVTYANYKKCFYTDYKTFAPKLRQSLIKPQKELQTGTAG